MARRDEIALRAAHVSGIQFPGEEGGGVAPTRVISEVFAR